MTSTRLNSRRIKARLGRNLAAGFNARLEAFAAEVQPLNTAAKLRLASQRPWRVTVNEEKQGDPS